MISQEEIYDLDSQTLESRVDLLQSQMAKWSPKSRKRGERSLQLAKLQIEEREADLLLHEFETKLSKFNFLYLDEQTDKQDNPYSSMQVGGYETKAFAKEKKNVVGGVSKKVFTIPKTDQVFQYKPIQPKKAVTQGKSKPNPKEGNLRRQNLYRSKSNSIAIKPPVSSSLKLPYIPASQPPQPTIESRQESFLQLITKKLQKEVKQESKVRNRVEYIQNEHSVSSGEGEESREQDIFKPELILTNQPCEENLQLLVPSEGDFPLQEEIKDLECQVQVQIETQPIQPGVNSSYKKEESPIILDTIDYFRFTVVKKKNQQEPTASSDTPSLQTNSFTNHFSDMKIDLQQQIDTIKQEYSEPVQSLCLSQRKPPVPVQVSPFQQRPQSQYMVNKKQKPIPKTHQPLKLLKQLPIPTITYNQIIPTFNHLFPPGSDLFANMRMMVGILQQHLKVKIQSNPRSNSKISQQFVYQKYSHLIDIQLKRQKEWVQEGNEEVEDPSTCLYYRVIKTKEEVYDIITDTLDRTGWYQLPHGMNLKQSWNLLWTWAKPQIDFKTLIYFQRVNHFVNNKQISRKDLLKKNIEKIKRLGVKIGQVFDIIPDTYLLPGEADNFIKKYQECELEKSNIWIMKPVASSRGRGIRLVRNLNDIYYDEPVVLQQYLKDPLLLDGFKFDMRIYVVVTNINPLEAYIYRQGFARMSTERYSLDDLDNNYVHLTNFSIQKENLKEATQSMGGSKISLKMLQKKLQSKGVGWDRIWSQIVQIVVKSLISCMNEIPSIPNCFELFGYDIIIDSKLKCWLLEVNSSPSLEKEYLLDELIKQQLIDDIIKLVDPVNFNRTRLKEVLERRVMEVEGRKSYINTNNNSTHQLNRDLCYILDGNQLRKYGERNNLVQNFAQVAPGEEYFRIIKILQSYKRTNIIKKV